MIKLFAVGDVMGRAGRRALLKALPRIREQYKPDIFLINGENAAGGYGITSAIYEEFIGPMGIDCITTGNHWHDNKDVLTFVDQAERLTVPANMSNVRDETMGLKILSFRNRPGRFAVLNFIGRAFMHDQNRSPFDAAARLMEKIPKDVKVRIVDIHAEATSEKQALLHFLTGKVSFVYGTHSHVPSADHRITKEGTGYVTDLGLTGAYDSVIGMDKNAALKRFLTGQKIRLEPAEDDPWVCAMSVDFDEVTGQCTHAERVIWKLQDL